MPVDRDKVLQAAQKLVEKKRYDKAIVELQKIVAEDPKDVRTLLKIGDIHLKAEQYAEAITTYERVGQFYSAQGFALKAIAVYKQIREIIRKHVPHLEDRFGHIGPKLAEIYTQLGLTSDALAAYDEVATRLQRAGRDRDAIDIFKKVVELDPTNPLPYIRLADAFVRVKDVDNAIQRFGAAAEILLKLGRRDDALKVVERLLMHRPDGRFARMAAEIYLSRNAQNDTMAALTKLQICFKENPKDLDTLASLARAFEQLGQPSKAIEVQKEAARIAREAGRMEAYNALVDALVLRAPNDEVVRQFAANRGPVGTSMPAAPPVESARTSSSVEVDLDGDEVVVVDDEEPQAAPFPLRQSQPSIQELDPVARLRHIIGRSDAERRARRYDQAATVLRSGIEQLPAARELREKLCDLLIEAGDQEGAVHQMLEFARAVAGSADVEGAARILDEVLLLEPNHPEAIDMLRALGYSLGPESQDAPQSAGAVAFQQQYEPGYDPDAPLPSYDLEEVGAAHALARRTPPPPEPAAEPISPTQLDDPFAVEEAPLPSFPMDEDSTGYVPAPESHRAMAPPAPTGVASERHPPPRPTVPPASSRTVIGGYRPQSEPPALLDEDALEEVEFFSQHGMFEEARAIIDSELGRLPNHPLLLERKRELEHLASGGQEHVAAPQHAEAPITEDVDRSFDIAASLDALDALDALEDSSAGPRASLIDPEEQQVSVEQVFEQFKAGVAAQISESDAATHYDLGMAYREMGLLADAISEFELASRDPTRECVCYSLIGMIQLDMQNIDAAIDAFIRGLHAGDRTLDQELVLTYEIANAYEMRGSIEQALYYFQRVGRIDPDYNDPRGSVQDRVTRLSPKPPPPQGGSAALAAGAEHVSDEFDAAFDELLSRGGKLP